LATVTTAPSTASAWLSATNGCASALAMRPKQRSSSSGASAMACANDAARTPSGSRSRDDRSAR
jgi:hypothetical protein